MYSLYDYETLKHLLTVETDRRVIKEIKTRLKELDDREELKKKIEQDIKNNVEY